MGPKSGKGRAKSPNRRSRAGCLPCRKRRRKCDGRRPICLGCQSRDDTCQWGLKVSFHPSRALVLSQEDTDALSAVEKQRQRQRDQVNEEGPKDASTYLGSEIVDDTEEIVRCFNKAGGSDTSDDESNDNASITGHGDYIIRSDVAVDDSSAGQGTHAHDDYDSTRASARGSVTGPATTSYHDISADHFGILPTETSPGGVSLGLYDSDPFAGSFVAPFSLGQAVSRDVSPLPEPDRPVSGRCEVDLLAAYVRETSTWCETTDSDMNFSISRAHLMFKSRPYVAAAMALASHQRDSIRREHSPLTLELYQYAIRLLITHDPDEADELILATCTVLCVYEMMASSVSEWRRHLKGCAGLLKTHGWNGDSDGIVKTCFWAFARIDVWAAFIINQSTLIPTDSWVADESLELAAAKDTIDDYCNLAILKFARIINLLNTHRRISSVPSASPETIKKAWEELQRWRQLRPPRVQPLLQDPNFPSGAFPSIVFSHASSICGNTFYHTGSILLLRSGCIRASSRIRADWEEMDPVWHAKQIGGISTSNPSHANWVNHLQPLYIAGQVFGGIRETPPDKRAGSGRQPSFGHSDYWNCQNTSQSASALGRPSAFDDKRRSTDDTPSSEGDHAVEKLALLKHLANIERLTGWKTSDRARDLRLLWGLEH